MGAAVSSRYSCTCAPMNSAGQVPGQRAAHRASQDADFMRFSQAPAELPLEMPATPRIRKPRATPPWKLDSTYLEPL